MAEGLLSKGISLKMGAVELPNLQEIPDLGGDPEQVEVTTLADGARRYISGIKDYGELEFTFLYDTDDAASSYKALRAQEEAGESEEFTITFPDNTTFVFSGFVSTTVGGVGVNDALTFTAGISLNSDIAVTFTA